MKRYLLGGLVLIVLVNLVVLGRVALNRFTGNNVSLQLTERELNVPYVYGIDKENTSLSLELKWRTAESHFDYWFSRRLTMTPEKLTSLGFAISPTANHRDLYSQGEQELYWLIEFNGSAYRGIVNQIKQQLTESELQYKQDNQKTTLQRIAELQKRLNEELNDNSRLIVIDVATDEQTLREKISSTNFIIVKGLARAGFDIDSESNIKPKPKSYYLNLNELLISHIHIPYALTEGIELQPDTYAAQKKNHFNAKVSWGSLLEPWVSSFDLVAENKNSEID